MRVDGRIREHVRASRPQVIAEVEAAGFARMSTQQAPGLELKENFAAEFRKVEPAPKRPDRREPR